MKRLHDPASAYRVRRMSRAIGFWLARLCAILVFCAGIAQAGPYDTWAKYKTLTINTTNTGGGANVSGTVSNFPVLVRLTTSNADDILGEALASGADVRFSSSDGSTALSYQIERWGTARADIWVLVPSVTGNSTTDIRIYWKKSGQSDASSASTVFATSNSFATVWHLNESPGAGANGFSDASGSGNTGTAQAGAGTDTVTAVAGKAFVLNGSTKYVSSASQITNSPNTITVSAWFKTANAYGSGGKIIGFGSAQTGLSGSYDRHIYMGNDGKINFGINKNNSGTLVAVTSASAYNDGNWHYATGRLSASGMFLYVDGTQVGTDATVTSGETMASAYWKAGYDNMDWWANVPTSRFLNGSLDEVVVSTTERSADWIKLNYQTQRTDATCILYGSTQSTTFYWNRNDVLTSSTDFNMAYNWTMNADGTGRRAPTSDDDDFTTTSQDAAWTCQDSDNDAGTGTCSQSTNYGSLTLSGRGADVWAANNQFTALRRSDITGDFDVTVKLTSLTATSVNAKAGITMADDFTTLGSGGFAGIFLRGDGKVEFLVDSTGTVGQMDYFTQSSVQITPSGGMVTGAIWLRLVKNGSLVRGYYRTSQSSSWTQQGLTTTAQSTSANSQIALLHTSQNTSSTGIAVFDEFQGGTTHSSSALNLSFAGTGSNADANSTLSAGQAAASIDFTGFTGTFNFGSSTLTINTGNATFVSGMTVTAGSGTLAFTGNSGTQTFTPKSGATFPAITKSGASGTVAVATSGLTAGAITLTSGTWQWGSGLTHSVASISTSAGSMDFGSSTVRVNSGNANLSNLASVILGTGTLSFTGTSGTQVLTPPSAISLPALTKTAASTLQLSTNALSCVSYAQTAGTLDFNSQNIAATGNFTVSSGTASSFSNLTGRTITVGGNASLAGQSGNLLNMGAGAWTLTVTGSLTADYATLGGSDASGGTQGVATNSFNAKGNANWLFSVPAILSRLTQSLRLNFNTTSSGANVPGNVTIIPVFVRFTASNLTFSVTSTDGSDLLFVDKDGSSLYHQVVEWDKSNKTGKVWVRVPQVDGNSTTDYVTLYYGCDSCTTNSYARGDSVWSDYAAAYHLSGGENRAYDAGKNAYHGTYQQDQAMIAGVTTKLAPVFNGTSDYITTTCPSNVATRTLSGWIYPRSSDNVVGMETVIDGDVSGQFGSGFGLDNGNLVVMLDNQWWNTNRAITLNTWQHVAVRFNASTAVLFVNGAATDSVSYTQGSVTSTTYTIGKSVANSYYFDGYLNDITVSDSYRSYDYIKLFYETQKAGSAFLTAFTTASFQNTKVFKLNTTASGANVTGDVANFPLLLRISGSTIVDAVAGSGTDAPADIRFLDGDGVTWLDYQVERWDRTGGIDSAEVWVRVPTVEGNYAGHTITMYYKQATGVTVVDGQCATCVFQTANNYVGAWHFNTSGTGARPDAVGSAGSLTTNNYSGSEFKGGVIAGADSLNGSNQYLSIASGLSDWSGGFTYTGWAYWASTGSYARLFDFGNGSTANNVYSGRHGTSTSMVSEIYNGASSGGQKTAASAISTGTWGHFAVTISGTTIKQYMNGSLLATATSSQSILTTTRANNYLGRSNWVADAYYQGKFDEVAIANTPRDSNWIKLCYQNQRNDASPLFNPSPADFVSTKRYTFNTTKTGANVTGDVTNFPLLVRITGSTITDAVEGSGVTIPPDIRFLDADGTTWLNYVVERWSRNSDSADVWVQIPQVDGNSDHDYITLYYNSVTNAAVPDGQCGSCVFGSANGFTGTWHMDDSASSATVTEAVSAQNGTWKYLTTNENTVNHTSSGIIGRSLDFGGSGGGLPSAGHADNFTHALALPKTTGTLSHWVKPDQVRPMVTLYESNGTTGTTYNGWGSVGVNQYEVNLGINNANAYGICYQDGTDGTTLIIGGGTPTLGTWAHVAATWDRSGNILVYVNGVQVASAAMSSVTLGSTAATVMQMGRVGDSTAARNWDGAIDEIQVSNVARSADWMKLAYETQRLSGNLFWNSRPGPNNKVTLTATATSSSNISLSWPSTVSDSSNADSVAIWVKYSAYPDSVGASATLVTRLAKTDTTYSYPATYPTTYWFALAVRNTSGQWSPFTSTSSDSATLVGLGITRPDTIYVDVTTGLPANSCASAQNPSTPKQTVKDALTCGASASDTLVVRVMPGTYTDSAFSVTASKPSIVTSFDNYSRAVFNGAGTATLDGGVRVWTLLLYGNMGIRNLDVKCLINGYSGVYVTAADNIYVEGCRIYNYSQAVRHGAGIEVRGGSNYHHFANNLIYQPEYHGMRTTDDNSFNVVNNVFVGPGGSGTGFWMATNAFAADMTLSNNIFYNWDYGITSNSANIGSCASNLFFGVTSGREVNTTTCTGSIVRDPLFASTTPTDRNAFKLLPGSPGIDAGSATYGSGAQAVTRRTNIDQFGTARPLGAAPDIGLYEGSGHTPNPAGEFDTLQVSSTATTATVQNSKWKLVWDKGRGAGITEFYDKTTNPATNLVYSNSLLFDAKIGAYTASSQTGAGPLLYVQEGTRARAVIRQNLPVSASLDLNIYYTVYPSGHVYIESDLSNLSAGTTAVTTVDYTLRMGSTTGAFTSADSTRGFGYLTTATRDAMLSVTRNLDGGASGTERWATSTAASGTPGTVVFNTTDLADLSQNTARRHDFLLYLGDNSLDFAKSAALNTDAYAPSALSMSAGSLLLERSWQDELQGHWTLDDGAGATARDKSVFVQNNATVAGANYKWVPGKVNGGLYLTTTDSAYVASTSLLNAANGFTVMFWLKPDFTGMGDTALIVSKGLSNAGGWYCRKVANASGTNKIVFTMGAATVTSPSLTDLAWSHIAVVANSGGNRNLEMYVNGVQVAASTAAATAVSNSLNLLLGYASGSVGAAKFKGTLDDVRVYKIDLRGSNIQSVFNRGFSSRFGHYALRADNNNRAVALINADTAKTRMQPAFFVANWFGPRSPNYVYLNGTRLTPNVDFVSDTIRSSALYGGSYLTLQLNKVLTGANQTLFIDDDDSTGFMGTATAMKTLTVSSTAGDKITVKNFSDTVFGGAASGQWYMEIDLNGWPGGTSANTTRVTDTGFGEINVWKAAAINPSVAVSSGANLVGYSFKCGRNLSHMKLDATNSSNEMFTAGLGYAGTANLTYTLTDSSSTRLSLVLSNISLSGDGTATVAKRFTFYPTGRVFVSYAVSLATIDFDTPRLDLNPRYDNLNPSFSWSTTTAQNNARWAVIGGSSDFHSIGMALLSLKNATSTYTSAASLVNSVSSTRSQDGLGDQYQGQFLMPTALWTSANKPVTVNFMMDFSKDFTDSATADSLLKDTQTPAVLTAISGTRVTADPLDFNADNFAEGDGAYTFAAATGIAHFKFANTVTSFNPAFRISSWTQGVLPEFVILDNQVLTKGYHYNAYLNTASNEVILQFNKTLAPGTHVFFISHKSGLAVSLRAFTAKGGEGVDTLAWTTESEFENLGFNVWRRPAPDGARTDSSLGEGGQAAGSAAEDSSFADTLPSLNLTSEELAALGYARINAKLIPGAKGGSSASTLDYRYIDRTAAFGSAYEYLLEAVDFNGGKVQYGPCTARPVNPLETELQSNYPNPFNPITTLRFTLKEKLKVSLIIYDSKGRMVRTLVRPDKPMLAGKYRVIWDARNEGGLEAPSGQYFYRFTAGRYVKTRKMILVK